MSLLGWGLFIYLAVIFIVLWLAYFIIRLAVKHGIEQSETHRLLEEIVQKIDKKDV